MRDVISILETAPEPSRSLDDVIARDVLGWVTEDKSGEWFEQNVPRYTFSIDAARTLVPDGCHWSLNDQSVARVGGPVAGFTIRGGQHGCPAIALCIAAIKARSGEAREAQIGD